MRDIVLIGASAGGLEPLRRVLEGLEAGFRGSVLAVMHLHPGIPSELAELLQPSSRIPVNTAFDGARISPGTAYVGVEDHHLTIAGDGTLRVRRGPKHNGYRPSVDALFQSGASSYGGRVVAVVLSGLLSDGTIGLHHVKRRGGIAIVQEPAEAAYHDMPLSALREIEVDHCVPSSEIARLITQYSVEMELPSKESAPIRDISPAQPPAVTCPSCGGTMVESFLGRVPVFACFTGHQFTFEALASAKTDEVDNALWAGLRLLREKRSLVERLCRNAESMAEERRASHFREHADEIGRHIELLEALLAGKSSAVEND